MMVPQEVFCLSGESRRSQINWMVLHVVEHCMEGVCKVVGDGLPLHLDCIG